MGKLSTHILDTYHGRPAAGMTIELHRLHAGYEELLVQTISNADGRTDAPLLPHEQVQPGRYRLCFHVAAYFRAQGVALPEPAFLEVVSVDFGLAETGGSYHVPLVCSPWAYSTYRGS